MLEALSNAIEENSVVLFLGGTDVGKTTLIRELHQKIGGEVIDADVGQSSIGPPACVSRGVYRSSTAPEIKASYFVGDISPRGNFLQVLTGIQHCLKTAKRPCLIDTDGYIADGAARAFKSEVINLVQPDALVLLQRGDELNYYKLYAQKKIKVLSIRVKHPGLKSREERIKAREESFRKYFQNAKLQSWSLKDLKFERTLLGHGEPLDCSLLSNMLGCKVNAAWKLGEEAILIVDGYALSLGTAKRALSVEFIHLVNASEIQHLLVGCLFEGRLQGLGILKSISEERVKVLTTAEQATVLQIGALHIFEDGRHERKTPVAIELREMIE